MDGERRFIVMDGMANTRGFVATAQHVAGDAVGVSDTDRNAYTDTTVDKTSTAHWYVAVVSHNREKRAAELLTALGYEAYVATQTEMKVWANGRKAKVERVVIGCTVFVKCTEAQRRHEVVNLPFINRFMVDRAAALQKTGTRQLAIISDSEIERLKFMLGQSDVPVTIEPRTYKVGDRVKVIRGSLAGLEGEVTDLKQAKSELIVMLEQFGCARLVIETSNLERVQD